MIDPFGLILGIIAADSAVASIASTRVSSEVLATPCVQLIDNSTSRRPFGVDSGRMGMQRWIGVARCWGGDSSTGAITARQLAGAVSDSLHNHRSTKVGTRYLARAYAPDIEGVLRDPLPAGGTGRPHYDVLIDAIVAADAV